MRDGTTVVTPSVSAVSTALPVLPIPQDNKGVKGGSASRRITITNPNNSTSTTTVPKLVAVLPKPRADATGALGTATAATAPPQSVASQPEVVALPSSVRPATAHPVIPSDVNNPEDACSNRVLLGRYSCMMAQCTKPLFQTHPACLEIQQIEQLRRDSGAQRY